MLLIATTPHQRDILDSGEYDVPPDKIRVIPPGYDDRRFFPVSLRHATGAQAAVRTSTGQIVLALGRMAKNKGYDLLIQAMPAVFERVDEARLLLAVGSTEPNEDEIEQVEALRQLADELGIADRVLFRDYIPDEHLADYYRAADVFALTSRYEPFGMTAVEAMACGTPTRGHDRGRPVGAGHLGPGGTLRQSVRPRGLRPRDRRRAAASARSPHSWPSSVAARPAAAFTWTGIAQQLLELC